MNGSNSNQKKSYVKIGSLFSKFPLLHFLRLGSHI
jgi:hypothetical protein